MKTISSATHTRAYCWYLLIFLTANFFALLGKEREGERERQGERGRGSQGGGEGERGRARAREREPQTLNRKPQILNPRSGLQRTQTNPY